MQWIKITFEWCLSYLDNLVAVSSLSKIDDYEYPVKAVHRDMSCRLGLSKIKGVHLHVNYIYNSLEVVGEEYSFLSFWFRKNLIRFVHISLIQVAEGFGSTKMT